MYRYIDMISIWNEKLDLRNSSQAYVQLDFLRHDLIDIVAQTAFKVLYNRCV
jgi:hypothetical protein